MPRKKGVVILINSPNGESCLSCWFSNYGTTCMRHAPIGYAETQVCGDTTTAIIQSDFPPIPLNMWCGDYQEKQDKE